MIDTATPAPRRGWWWLGLGLLWFFLAADLPLAQTLLPVHRPLLLLVPLVSVCAVIGWWRGGSMLLALASISAAVALVIVTVRAGVSSDVLVAGWALLAAGCFGLGILAARSRKFLGTAVVAVLAALVLAAGLLVTTPGGPVALREVEDAVLRVRSESDLNGWRNARAELSKPGAPGSDSSMVSVLDQVEQSVASMPSVARLVLPSLLALQTLVAMALAWVGFHRFSRTRIGDELSRLRDFRFNDHWIWSVVIGLVLALLPAVSTLRPLGINLLVFFGALYALRGLAVLAWFLRPGRSFVGLLVGVALLLLLRDGAAIALGLVGLGDTWADWRRRIRPAVS
jgi:hypothetical protein